MYKIGKHFVSSLRLKLLNSISSNDDSIDDVQQLSRKTVSGYSSATNMNLNKTPAVGRKRSRGDSIRENTPILVHPNSVLRSGSGKRRRLKDAGDVDADADGVSDSSDHLLSASASLESTRFQDPAQSSLLLDMIPQDVLQTNIASYLTDSSDHYSLQLTCRKFHEVSNKPDMLSKVNLNGDPDTGKGSILYGIDVPDVAFQKLFKFAAVGNQQAMYMVGMIAAYCHGDKLGVDLLRQNADRGCLRSAYTLGLILRDCDKAESECYLRKAIESNYLPACQELLSSQAVKDKFGDLDYQTLKKFFDPIALNRLLGRSYLQSSGVRRVSTSHCWNPCCGRWALKATQQNNTRGPTLQYSSKYLSPISPNVEFTLLNLLDDDKKKESCAKNFPRPRSERSFRVSRMKMCSSCRRAKYCSKLCQVYDWRSGQHKMECQFL